MYVVSHQQQLVLCKNAARDCAMNPIRPLSRTGGMKTIVLTILLLMPAILLQGHDLWLSALPQQSDRPGEVLLTLSVGERLDVHELMQASDVRRMTSFEALSIDGVRNLREEVHGKSSAIISLARGTHLISMQRPPSNITLDLETARHYLEEEHHEHLVDRIPVDAMNMRERFSRHLKTIVQVGDRIDETWRSTVGQTLEIVPLDNPLTARAGDSLRVLLLLESSPLEDAPIWIFGAEGEDIRSEIAYTNRYGIASLTIPAPGSVLIRTVHVRPVEGDELIDLESFWAALTFPVE